MGEQILGEIRYYGCNFTPAGWAACDGNALPVAQYQNLFSLIGTTYGGDGAQTFRLPDLRGSIPLHMGTGADLPERAIGPGEPLHSAPASQDATRTVGSLAVNPCIAVEGYYPGNFPDFFIGQIVLFAFSSVPKGFAECNGQLLSIMYNQALFSLLGTRYGGDGRTTFAVPDLRGRAPVHQGNGLAVAPQAMAGRTPLRGAAPSENSPALGIVTLNFCISVEGIYPSRHW